MSSLETSPDPVPVAAGFNLADGKGGRSDSRSRRSGNRPGILGVIVLSLVALLTLLALAAPLLPLQDPINPDYDHVAEAPQTGHLLGTDLHGRDQLSRIVWASRTALLIGVVATGIAMAAGIAVGGAAACSASWFDSTLMRVTDVFLSFPIVIGAIGMMAILGPGRHNVFLAIAFFGWPVFARIFRSSVLSTKEKGFVKAARILGAGDARIYYRHILPNSLTPILSYGAMAVGGAILIEAGLSFINLGVQRPNPSWGLMLSESMGQFEQAPWLLIAPGLAVSLTVLIFILLGTVVSRVLDPYNREG